MKERLVQIEVDWKRQKIKQDRFDICFKDRARIVFQTGPVKLIVLENRERKKRRKIILGSRIMQTNVFTKGGNIWEKLFDNFSLDHF